YYQETADTKKYKQLSNKGKLTKNKENFIQYSKWLHIIKDKTKKPKGILNKLKYLWYRQKTKNRKDIEAQIKTYGLPKVNQQLLAEDITNLFNDIILDLIKNKIDKAKKNKILF
ncbi:MAG: hypothetical protein U9M94_03580, partial [Patescibacteria group bacterium]|nr:hypothetical protein [Patescibacteria group bacterium]